MVGRRRPTSHGVRFSQSFELLSEIFKTGNGEGASGSQGNSYDKEGGESQPFDNESRWFALCEDRLREGVASVESDQMCLCNRLLQPHFCVTQPAFDVHASKS